MATFSTVTVKESCCIGIDACDEVILCLDDSWSDKTVSGLPFVTGKVSTINKVLQIINKNTCSEYTVGRESCDYIVDVELDGQVLIDPETDLPYPIVDADVEGISRDVCVINKLIDIISELFPEPEE